VHTGIESHPVSGERLETSSHMRIPLQDGHLVTLLGQKRTGEKPADAPADNHYMVVRCHFKAQMYTKYKHAKTKRTWNFVNPMFYISIL
jgi:hypothetical protein